MATLGVVVQRFKQQSIHELSARTKTSGCCARRPLGFTVLFYFNINHLRPNIQIQILQTDLHIFPYRISWANLFVDQGFSHQVMILLTLTTFSLNFVGRKLTFFTLETSRVNWISLKVPALWLFMAIWLSGTLFGFAIGRDKTAVTGIILAGHAGQFVLPQPSLREFRVIPENF